MSDWTGHTRWDLVLPPSRPTPEELASIRHALHSIGPEEPIAILGSTPEYRDLLARAGFTNVHVIDASDRFHHAMTQLCAYRESLTEAFHNSTWQSHFSSQHQYRAILSDLTLGNVPYDDREQLYGSLSSSVVPGGVFIDKVLTNEGPRYSLAQIASHFARLPVNLRTINDFNCIALFCSEIIFADQVDTVQSYETLHHEFHKDPHLLELARRCEDITPTGMCWYYGRPWTEVSKAYVTDAFQLTARVGQYCGSPYEDHAYQFVYRRR